MAPLLLKVREGPRVSAVQHGPLGDLQQWLRTTYSRCDRKPRIDKCDKRSETLPNISALNEIAKPVRSLDLSA